MKIEVGGQREARYSFTMNRTAAKKTVRFTQESDHATRNHLTAGSVLRVYSPDGFLLGAAKVHTTRGFDPLFLYVYMQDGKHLGKNVVRRNSLAEWIQNHFEYEGYPIRVIHTTHHGTSYILTEMDVHQQIDSPRWTRALPSLWK